MRKQSDAECKNNLVLDEPAAVSCLSFANGTCTDGQGDVRAIQEVASLHILQETDISQIPGRDKPGSIVELKNSRGKSKGNCASTGESAELCGLSSQCILLSRSKYHLVSLKEEVV